VREYRVEGSSVSRSMSVKSAPRIRRVAQVLLDAPDVEIRPRLAQRRSRLDGESADVRPAQPARQLEAGVDRDDRVLRNGEHVLDVLQADPPREERERRRLRAEGEDLGALQEEEALLGEEERGAAEVELLGVRLGLLKIDVDGHVRLRRGGQPVAAVQS
jgi:hypothetical protein